MSGEAGDVGFKQAMQQKWLALDKSGGEPRVVRKVEVISDRTQLLLQDLADGKEVRSTAAPYCWGCGGIAAAGRRSTCRAVLCGCWSVRWL